MHAGESERVGCVWLCNEPKAQVDQRPNLRQNTRQPRIFTTLNICQ